MLRRKPFSILVLTVMAGLLFLDTYRVVPSWVFALLFFIFLFVTICGSFFIGWNYHLRSIHGNKTSKNNQIALTFDDGPHPEFTPKVLDLLQKHHMKASFFCIGKQIEAHPEILKRILSDGHTIGNHTFSHSKFFGFFSTAKVMDELTRTTALVKALTGLEMRLYRPIFGVTNPMIEKAVNHLNLVSIGWRVRSLDTTSRAENVIFNRIASKVAEGDIVLLHDSSQKTVGILERLLVFLEEKKLTSVTLDELLQLNAYV